MAASGSKEGEGRGSRLGRTAVAVCLWLVVWQLASFAIGSPLLLAGPIDTFVTLVTLVAEPGFWAHVWWSFSRIAGGFLLAFVLALILAGLASRRSFVADLLRPAMSFIKSTPVVCIVVILLIWFGSAQVSAVSVFLVVLPAIYFSALEALGEVDSERLEMLRLFGVGPLRRTLAVTWPQMQPFLFATCQMVVGMSWKAGVAAELIGTPAGSIGERIYQAKLLLESAELFSWTIVVVLAAYVCERVFLALLARSAAWSQRLAVRHRPSVPNVAPGPIALSGVRIAFDGRSVLDNLSLELPAGSRTCLCDPSGAGKTTALRIMAGLAEPDAGSCSRPARITMAWQATCLIESLDAVDNVLLVAGDDLDEASAKALLLEVLPASAVGIPVSELSGGERRRVEVVRALAARGSAVLLDEPFASLDEESHARLADFVMRHLDGRTLVVATHDLSDVAALDAAEVSVAAG